MSSKFLCLLSLVLGDAVKMKENAPTHISTGNTYAANCTFLTDEELRTVGLLQRIETMFTTLEVTEKDELIKKRLGRFGGNEIGFSRTRRPTSESLSVEEGDNIQNRYKILAELGEGYHGKVFKCKDLQTDTVLSIKIMKNSADKQYTREIRMLSMLASLVPKDQNLFVEMYDWFDYQGHKCITFELLGKSVFKFLKDNNNSAFPIEHVRQIAYELCYTVAFMHAKGFTHNDIHPKNILIHDDEYYNVYLAQKDKTVRILKTPGIRLIDFGNTTFDELKYIVSTPHKAPEVVMALGVTQASDIWSVGCVIFELAMGFKMFDTHSRHKHLAMMERILGKIPSKMVEKSSLKYFSSGKLRWDENSSSGRDVRKKVQPLLKFIPREKRGNKDWEELFQMISQMLRYEPSKRSSLAECLEHPFLKKFKPRGEIQ